MAKREDARAPEGKSMNSQGCWRYYRRPVLVGFATLLMLTGCQEEAEQEPVVKPVKTIILGDSGERVGEDMTAGDIFVAGKVQDLGSDATLTDTEQSEIDDIREFLDRYEIPFNGSFQKIVNAGKKLRYGTAERQMRSIPFFTFSGGSDYWNPKTLPGKIFL